MLSKYGYIFFSPDADPKMHRIIMESGGLTTIIVAVPDPSMAPQVAAEMVAGGVELIELCGIFGPIWTAKVIEATGNRVPVGAVAYGVESIASLAGVIAE
jgi:hypothetical protein